MLWQLLDKIDTSGAKLESCFLKLNCQTLSQFFLCLLFFTFLKKFLPLLPQLHVYQKMVILTCQMVAECGNSQLVCT